MPGAFLSSAHAKNPTYMSVGLSWRLERNIFLVEFESANGVIPLRSYL
jgi:hypothetical protein